MKKKQYKSPIVNVVGFKVEHGFAGSVTINSHEGFGGDSGGVEGFLDDIGGHESFQDKTSNNFTDYDWSTF